MSVDIEIVKLIEQPGRVTPIGLAFAVEHFSRHHVRFQSDLAQLAMERVAKAARLLHQHHPMFASNQFFGQANDGAATTFAAVNRPSAGNSHHQHSPEELDIARQMNHTGFGPTSFKDCRKMGNNVIFEFVVNHTSRMAPPRAVLEGYMTPTSDRCAFTLQMTSTISLRATRALVRRRSSCFR